MHEMRTIGEVCPIGEKCLDGEGPRTTEAGLQCGGERQSESSVISCL